MYLVGAGTLSVKLPLNEVFACIKRCGFQWVDLLLVSGWSQIGTRDLTINPDECYAVMETALKRSGLSIASINAKFSVPFEERSSEGTHQRNAEYEALFKLMERFHVRRASVQSTLSSDEREFLRSHPAAMDEVSRLQDHAERRGLLFSLEPHIMSSVCTAQALQSVWSQYPGFRFTYDPSHLLYMGHQIQETDCIAERTAVVHLRDAGPGRLLVPYGQGRLNMPHVVGTLKRCDYDGPIVVEYMADRQDGEGMDTQILLDMQRFCEAFALEWGRL